MPEPNIVNTLANMQSLPGWKMNIDVVSSGIFKVTLTNSFGNTFEVIDVANNETIQKAIIGAFEVERQVSKNWNRFIFELCLQELNDIFSIAKYDDEAFGSWYVVVGSRRIVYDGRDFYLTLQARNGNGWDYNKSIKRDALTYNTFISLINDRLNTSSKRPSLLDSLLIYLQRRFN